MRFSFLRYHLSVSLLSTLAISDISRQSGVGVYPFNGTGCDATSQIDAYNNIVLNQDYVTTTPFQSFEFSPALVPGMAIAIKIPDCTQIIATFDNVAEGQMCLDLSVTAQCFRINAPPDVAVLGKDFDA